MKKVKSRVFRFDKEKWKYRAFKTPGDTQLEQLYYAMMFACWNGNNEDDRIKKDIAPCVRRAIVYEMNRLKKKVGI
jgi:hypothetical protein